MKLPEFQDPAVFESIATTTPAALPAAWHDLMGAKSVAEGEVLRTVCDGMGLFIYREKKSISVYDSRCPHQSTDIPDLAVHGTKLTCPKHQWEFDAKSGDCIKKGNSPLKRIESKVVKGRLMAFW
jgi:nitrite reductase/ring-hydroxylating ferredoxin subunit